MFINARVQYGLLLCLYLSRSGRSTLETVCSNLNLSLDFVYHVAGSLRRAGLIKSFRGPNGGYELVRDITMGEIYHTLGGKAVIASNASKRLARGESEARALITFLGTVSQCLQPFMRTRISDMNKVLVTNEMSWLEKANTAVAS